MIALVIILCAVGVICGLVVWLVTMYDECDKWKSIARGRQVTIDNKEKELLVTKSLAIGRLDSIKDDLLRVLNKIDTETLE